MPPPDDHVPDPDDLSMGNFRKVPGSRSRSSEPPTSKADRPDRDRRVRQADRLARILRVLELIQSRGRWTTRAIAEELECSERTVYRDLDVLRFAGIPYYREGDQQFLRLRPDFRFPPLSLTDDELLGLSVASTLTKSPGLDVTAGAGPTVKKLAALSEEQTQELIDDSTRLVSVLDLKLADHSRHHEAIRTIQHALLQGNQIGSLYESPYEPRQIKLKLHPYRLCLIKNAWYLIARPDAETSPRTFRVTRFKAIRTIDQPNDAPVDFDLRSYFGNAWAVYRGETSYSVELWFAAAAAGIVTETIWHSTQNPTHYNDGSVTLKFEVDGLPEIANWVLRWTGKCRIVNPPELRDRVMGLLEAGLSMHRNSQVNIGNIPRLR